MPPAERSGTAATAAAAATTISKSTAAASEAAGAESEPIPTNLDNPPEAIACTVSPPTTYAFLKPTPVVLLTGPFGGNWCFRETWQTSLADQGYQSTSIELAMPPQKLDSGDAYIRHFVKVLKTSIETDHSFYPPILIAHGLHALVAQKYVESNPVSALVLVSPFIPEIIKGRFQELSHKLQIKGTDPSPSSTAAAAAATSAEAISVTDPKVDGEQSSSATAASATAQATPSEQQPEYKFETHADVLAQEGFRETYVLPKKAVYKIDLVAKEIQEKEKAKEKEQKEKKEEREQEDEKEEKAQKEQREQKEHMSANGSPGDATEESTATTTSTTSTPETLGKDSVPVGESAADAQVTPEATVDQEASAKQTMELKEQEEAFYPEQTVESEASIHSPLEQLPLAIYDSIPKSQFEPTFPILLVTSNADEIVSTADVKDHHFLAQEVDHIELEDRDDGGHLIMVSDNTEWEQGIQGITAWLDSNGM
ncbi:hypothetical protein BGZ75_000233 [Mortierella antarctica]|nr:hypothetical protein BGZ75_000233 [Mortierella antarctica]